MLIKNMYNRFLLNLSYLLNKEKSLGFPRELVVELSNKCNLDCIMCKRTGMKRKQGNMPFKLFKKIIDQVPSFVELVDFDHSGESMLNPDFFKMLKYCKDRNLKVQVSSNFSHLTKKQIGSLINLPPDLLTISFDGAKKEAYEKIRKGADYDKTLKNIKYYLKNRKRPSYVIIQTLYMDETAPQIRDFINKWKEEEIDSIRIKPLMSRHNKKTTLENYLFLPTKNKKCIMPWNRLVIYWDGTVVPCCYDCDSLSILGNLKKQSINEVWNNNKFVDFRRNHIKNKLKDIRLCRYCNSITPSFLYLFGSTLFSSLAIKKILPFFEKRKLTKITRRQDGRRKFKN